VTMMNTSDARVAATMYRYARGDSSGSRT
jgi:hypothetical protein